MFIQHYLAVIYSICLVSIKAQPQGQAKSPHQIQLWSLQSIHQLDEPSSRVLHKANVARSVTEPDAKLKHPNSPEMVSLRECLEADPSINKEKTALDLKEHFDFIPEELLNIENDPDSGQNRILSISSTEPHSELQIYDDEDADIVDALSASIYLLILNLANGNADEQLNVQSDDIEAADLNVNNASYDCTEEVGDQDWTLIERLGIAPLGPVRSEGPSEVEEMMKAIIIHSSSSTPQTKGFASEHVRNEESSPTKVTFLNSADTCDSRNRSFVKQTNQDSDQQSGERNHDNDFAEESEDYEDADQDFDERKKIKNKTTAVQVSDSNSTNSSGANKHFVPVIYISGLIAVIIAFIAFYLYYVHYRRRSQIKRMSSQKIPSTTAEDRDDDERPFSNVAQMQSPSELGSVKPKRTKSSSSCFRFVVNTKH